MKCFQNVMKVEEIKGQRILRSFLVPEDKSRIEVFAKNIPQNLDEDEIVPFFECVGPLYCLRLMMNQNNEGNRGFAYITYLDSQDALWAVKYLNGKEIAPNYPVKVSISMNNCRIFVGGIPVHKSKDEVWQEMGKKGISGIVDVIMYRSYSNRAENRGFVFVEFPTHQYAAKMRNQMMNMYLWNKKVIVDWSVPEQVVPEEDMKKVKILYLRNLQVMETREYLKALIGNYVKPHVVEKIYKFKNYAFIHLVSREIALELLFALKEHYRNTPVEVVFAKPCTEYTKPEFRKKILTRYGWRVQNPERYISHQDQPNTPYDNTKKNSVYDTQSSSPTSEISDIERISRKLKEYLKINDSHASGSLSEIENLDFLRYSTRSLKNSLLKPVDNLREKAPLEMSSSSEPELVPSTIWSQEEAVDLVKTSESPQWPFLSPKKSVIPEKLPKKAELESEDSKFQENEERWQYWDQSPIRPDLSNGKNGVPSAEYQNLWPSFPCAWVRK